MPLNESGRTKTVLWMACLLLLAADGQARANGAGPCALRDVGFDQRLGAQLPLELRFREEQGTSVELSEYFRNKPIILMFAYYDCPNLCPLALEGLVKSLKALSFEVGKEFDVVVVSIDAKKGPALATTNKEKYVQKYGRPGAERGWHFLKGEEASIKQLTEAVGFRYAYDAEKDQYAHASGIIILTPQGRISRYLYGIEYPPRDVRLGLVEASAGRIGSPVDQLLLLCYQYDPVTGKYTVAITNVLRLAGVATALGLGSCVFIMVRRERLGRAKTDKEGIQNV
ncbi:MAG: SCO family protein [Candidatus Binatia bacterium]